MRQPDQESADMEKLRKDNANLRSENSKLKRQLSSKPAVQSKRRWRNVFRKSVAVLLVALGVALLAVANLFFWTGHTIVKEDRFVAATQPLIKDPEVQNSMALYATNSIFSNVDVQQKVESVLPPRADFLAPQLTNQVKSFTQSTFQKVLTSPKFQDKWNAALAKQHQRLISFASKYQGDGDISLNDVFNDLSASLGDTKLAFLADKQLPPKVGDITLISAPWLPAFHNLVTKIDTWRLLAIVLLVVCVAGAVWLSHKRRRTLYFFSFATAAVMLATLIALHAIRARILSKVDPQYALGVQHAIQIIFHSLVIQTLIIMAVGLLVGIVAWISGPASSAVALRRQVSLYSSNTHSRIFGTEHGWTTWIRKHKRFLEWLVVGVIACIMLIVNLTFAALLVYVLVASGLILAIEIFGG